MQETSIQPELLDVTETARLIGQAISTVHKAHRAGRMPAPVRLGRSIRWRRAELLAWIQAGCPSREAWEAANT